jgi:hypothetical protein
LLVFYVKERKKNTKYPDLWVKHTFKGGFTISTSPPLKGVGATVARDVLGDRT